MAPPRRDEVVKPAPSVPTLETETGEGRRKPPCEVKPCEPLLSLASYIAASHSSASDVSVSVPSREPCREPCREPHAAAQLPHAALCWELLWWW